MLLETGRVVAVEKDGLWVETIRQSTCGSCAARKGCGHSLINRISEGRHGYIRVLPGRHAIADCLVDDRVTISIPEEVVVRGSLIVYLLPLAFMLLGAAVAVQVLPGGEDLLAAGGAIAGLAVGFGLVRWHARRHRHDERLQPTLVEILRPPGQSARPA